MNWRGTWGSGTSYLKNDTVYYAGNSWIAITDDVGVTPAVGSSQWQLVAQSGTKGTDGSGGGIANFAWQFQQWDDANPGSTGAYQDGSTLFQASSGTIDAAGEIILMQHITACSNSFFCTRDLSRAADASQPRFRRIVAADLADISALGAGDYVLHWDQATATLSWESA
jgi:hypothetical protein